MKLKGSSSLRDRVLPLVVLTVALLETAGAQQTLRRFEIGAQAPGLHALGQTSWCAACLKLYWSVGPAATFNLNEHFAVDGAVTFFRGPSGNPSGLVGGNLMEAVAGLKASVRGSRFTLFAKVRPGIIRWSQGQIANVQFPASGGRSIRTPRGPTSGLISVSEPSMPRRQESRFASTWERWSRAGIIIATTFGKYPSIRAARRSTSLQDCSTVLARR